MQMNKYFRALSGEPGRPRLKNCCLKNLPVNRQTDKNRHKAQFCGSRQFFCYKQIEIATSTINIKASTKV